jgi:Abortive infection alpha
MAEVEPSRRDQPTDSAGLEVEPGPIGLDAVPGLARIAASAWWHTTEWAVHASVKASRRLAAAALSPEKAIELAQDVVQRTEQALTELINATDERRRAVNGAAPVGTPARRASSDVAGKSRRPSSELGGLDRSGRPRYSLRDEGESLLRRSRDVRHEVDAHPAYERILSELAPDEGRVLRLLLLEGPQPAVDVRTGGPLGMLKSSLIAPGISMIGARAGCRYVERVPSYLNNLFRLGLIWFSRETLRDHLKYQVLEAQPEVLEAIHSVRFAKVVRRSIHLTPFGEDFCQTCLVPRDAVLGDLPEHSVPPETGKTAQPPAELAEG